MGRLRTRSSDDKPLSSGVWKKLTRIKLKKKNQESSKVYAGKVLWNPMDGQFMEIFKERLISFNNFMGILAPGVPI